MITKDQYILVQNIAIKHNISFYSAATAILDDLINRRYEEIKSSLEESCFTLGIVTGNIYVMKKHGERFDQFLIQLLRTIKNE